MCPQLWCLLYGVCWNSVAIHSFANLVCLSTDAKNNCLSDESQVWFFEQGTMPCLSPEGKIILELVSYSRCEVETEWRARHLDAPNSSKPLLNMSRSPGSIACNPDGNGGVYPVSSSGWVILKYLKSSPHHILLSRDYWLKLTTVTTVSHPFFVQPSIPS